MENKFTPEQISDIEAREKLCLEFLKEHQMTPSCQITKVNIGNDAFADKLTPFLNDTKYTNVPSPIQSEDLNK